MSKRGREIRAVFDAVSLGAPEKAVGFVLWRVLHRYVREIDRALEAVDLTHLQFTTLAMTAWLGRSDEPITQAEVARFAEMHAMQVSLMLTTLERKGMIARSRSAANVRAKNIEVTATGIRTLREALPIAIEVQRRLFGPAGEPGGELLRSLLGVDEPSRP